MLRTFVAVELDAAVRSRALDLIERLRGCSAKVKWVERENLHWTLQFLGDVPIEQTPAICRAVTEAVAPLPAFEVEAHGAGAFPSASRPRTLWLGARQGRDAMIVLNDVIQSALEPLAFRGEDRRFQPHATLGRVRGPQGLQDLAQLLKKHADFAAGTMTVSEVVVFSSQLGRDGPSYEALGRSALAG